MEQPTEDTIFNENRGVTGCEYRHQGHKKFKSKKTMKKHIIIAAVLSLICLNNLFAQEKAPVNATVIRSFESEFSEASNLRWEPQQRGILLAKFRFENESWIAYYSREGTLITSGRKVESPNLLPIKVKNALENVQDKYEQKYGTFARGTVFEMTTDNGTEYFIPLENVRMSVLVSINDSGISTVERKEKHSSPIATNGSAIAKKN